MAIEVTHEKDSLLIRFTELEVALNVMNQALTAGDKNPTTSMVIFDFSGVKSILPDALAPLVQYSSQLESRGSRLMILLKKNLADSFGAGSVLEPSYVIVSGSYDAQVDAVPITEKLLKKLAVEALAQTLETYIHTSIKVSESFYVSKNKLPKMEIAATVEFEVPPIKRTLILIFSRSTFRKLLSQLNPGKNAILSAQNQDWSAEFLNVTLGRVKSQLNEKGHTLSFSIPKLIDEKELHSFVGKNPNTQMVVLRCKLGKFYLGSSRL